MLTPSRLEEVMFNRPASLHIDIFTTYVRVGGM